jgi:putative copper export protein
MMRTLYLLSVYLHILSAIVWTGGIAFVVFVVVPWLRRDGQGIAGRFLRETGERFRSIGWLCFGVLLVTGTFNLWMRGVTLASFSDSAWLSSAYGRVITLKLTIFVAVVATSLVHDFVVGPRATRAILADAASRETQQLRRKAALLGRLNAVFALLLVALAVMIVRGTP